LLNILPERITNLNTITKNRLNNNENFKNNDKNENILEKVYETIKVSPELSEKIIKLFLKQNYQYLFSGKESVSLLNSKKNYITVKLIPLNSKPYEE